LFLYSPTTSAKNQAPFRPIDPGLDHRRTPATALEDIFNKFGAGIRFGYPHVQSMTEPPGDVITR